MLHGLIVEFLAPKLEKSTTLYGSLGAMTTILFFMYFAGRLVVTSPILNSALHQELRKQSDDAGDDRTRRLGLHRRKFVQFVSTDRVDSAAYRISRGP